MEIEKILTSNVVDLNNIKKFFSSDKKMVMELIDVFLTDTTPRIATLEENTTTLNYDEVKSVAHFLKSSIGWMGIKCLDEIEVLEELAQNKQPETIIKKQLNFIIPICKESIEEYKLILNKLEAL
jgi:HPt (histidine-containing phosphotransfer) domain-containing protein